MLLYATITDATGTDTGHTFNTWGAFHSATFCPDASPSNLILFQLRGRSREQRRESLREIVQRWTMQAPGLSYGEIADAESWIEDAARRCGMIRELHREGII